MNWFNAWMQHMRMAGRLRREAPREAEVASVLMPGTLTLGEEGFVNYQGMSLSEIVSYGWVERDVDLSETPDMRPDVSEAPQIPLQDLFPSLGSPNGSDGGFPPWKRHFHALSCRPPTTEPPDDASVDVDDAYQVYLRNREADAVERERWDPADPDPRNPWNADKDADG